MEHGYPPTSETISARFRDLFSRAQFSGARVSFSRAQFSGGKVDWGPFPPLLLSTDSGEAT
jgi:hypothetical protein